MSILGYSASYFLPQYWANTPLYGEKIIPLLDYVLSTDYQNTDKLASAFYDIESKYKNTADLPIDKIEAIVEENGYKYIRDLLAPDEESLKFVVYILVLINQLKGSKKGLETVLKLLKMKDDDLQLTIAGHPKISDNKEAYDFSATDYITYSNFTVGDKPFELIFKIRTSNSFENEQCIISSPDFGFYLGIDESGLLTLRVGKVSGETRTWQTLNGSTVNKAVKPLLKETEYYVKFYYSGVSYGVSVSTDGNTYSNYIDLDSSDGLGITGGTILLGIDGSTSTKRYPFQGAIVLAPVNIAAENIVITQWFEMLPVDEENTFIIDANVDINLVSADFFVKFAKFVERYVYPSLTVLKARMALKAKLTFLPYVRQKVDYVASNIFNISDNYEPYVVVQPQGGTIGENYNVEAPSLYAWTYDGYYVYTLSEVVFPATKLYNRDMSVYEGSNFYISEIPDTTDEYAVYYQDNRAERDDSKDEYSGTPFLVVDNSD